MKLTTTVWIVVLSLFWQVAVVKEARVYVVARRSTGGLDLGAEKKLKEEIAKQKNIKPVLSAADADVVLLVLTEYETADTAIGGVSGGNGSLVGVSETYLKTATALALPSSEWGQHKDNLEKLRERATWQGGVVATALTRASLSKLAKKYIESLGSKK